MSHTIKSFSSKYVVEVDGPMIDIEVSDQGNGTAYLTIEGLAFESSHIDAMIEALTDIKRRTSGARHD